MDNLIDFNDLTPGNSAVKRLAQAFTRAGAPVVSIDIDPKTRRSSGVTYRSLTLTFNDSQKVEVLVKQTGDIYQVKLNGSIQPLKNQSDQRKAVGELVKYLDAGRAKFQAKMARVKAELPKGIKTAAPRMEAVLRERSASLDTEIAEAQTKVKALKEELGETLDSVLDDGDLTQAVEIAGLVNGNQVLDSNLADALIILGIALETSINNYPIYLAEGNAEQAAICLRNIESFKKAIAKLQSVAPAAEQPDGTAQTDVGDPRFSAKVTRGVGQLKATHEASSNVGEYDEHSRVMVTDSVDDDANKEGGDDDDEERVVDERQESLFDDVAGPSDEPAAKPAEQKPKEPAFLNPMRKQG